MNKLYTSGNEHFLAYHKQETSKNKAPYVVFLHGLLSDMSGHKAQSTEAYCLAMGYNFIKFDNFGHGNSSGKFTDQTISTWLNGINLIINELVDGRVLLVGSSMGAWIAMLAAKLHPEKIIGVITLAAALDFTEEIIWNNLTEQEKEVMIQEGIYLVGGKESCDKPYPIAYQLIIDGRKHLLLGGASGEKMDVSCPVCMIHGMVDEEVPYNISIRAAKILKSTQVTVKLIKDANHRLARDEDLQVLYNSIDEMMCENRLLVSGYFYDIVIL